jgi:mRNA interferase MazF
MAIRYPVGPGTILLCDYSLGGFRPPEMIKRRPAIVLSPRLAFRDNLCSVVPLSGSAPARQVEYVVRLALPKPLPAPFEQDVWWAKCDMIATVSFERLDLFRTGRDQSGKRKYIHPVLMAEDMARVRQGVLAGLGLKDLTIAHAASI